MSGADNLLHKINCIPKEGWSLILAEPMWIKKTIPKRTMGIYIMVSDREVIYVGRSDECLHARLVNHEHLCHAKLIAWIKCSSKRWAYILESKWYNKIKDKVGILNKIEPAKPKSTKNKHS